MDINNLGTGKLYGGGGGGGGGYMRTGAAGGNLGEPGVKSVSGYEYGRAGEPGRLIWWNTSNLSSHYTITNTNLNELPKGLDNDTDAYLEVLGFWEG